MFVVEIWAFFIVYDETNGAISGEIGKGYESAKSESEKGEIS